LLTANLQPICSLKRISDLSVVASKPDESCNRFDAKAIGICEEKRLSIGAWMWLGNFKCFQKLVGGIPAPLKNMKVSWDDEIPNLCKIIKFHGSKPPTRCIVMMILIII
jgi:hypothetical protein